MGDTKGLLESVFREHDIKWICNSRIDNITQETVHVSELNEDGQLRRQFDPASRPEYANPDKKEGGNMSQNEENIPKITEKVLINSQIIPQNEEKA